MNRAKGAAFFIAWFFCVLILCAFLLGILGCTSAQAPNGAKYTSFGQDVNIVAGASTMESQGGPTSLMSGGSRGNRSADFAQVPQPGSISIGGPDGIQIVGATISSSQPIDSTSHGLGMLARVWGMVRSIEGMFDFAKVRDTNRRDVDLANSNNTAGVESLRISEGEKTARQALRVE